MLAYHGHDVVGIDIDEGAWLSPRVDDEMADWLVTHNRGVVFSTSYKALRDRELILIFVSTPFRNGRLDDSNVIDALAASAMENSDAEYSILSTLPVGSMKVLRQHFPELKLSYSPPMIKKHRFLSTFVKPPSGWQLFTKGASDDLRNLYASMQPGVRQIVAPDEVVEAAKLCTNMMLATKVIMANSIADWLGYETGKAVCEIVSADPRIGEGYFAPGGKASGPCLPRDLLELEEVTPEGHLKSIVQALNAVNRTEELV